MTAPMKLDRPLRPPGLLVVAGLVRIIERGRVPGLVKLGTSEEVSALELGRRIHAIVDRGRVEHVAQRRPQNYRETIDWSRAREVLGWEPPVALDEGLRRVWRWWRQRPSAAGLREPAELSPHASQGRP